MLVFTPVDIFTAQELGVLGSWREMEISSMQMELILKNLRTTNWYNVKLFTRRVLYSVFFISFILKCLRLTFVYSFPFSPGQ